MFAENLKCSNAIIDKILVDQKSKLLYCSTKEGLLLFIDISKKQPVLCHSLKLVKVPETGRNYIKQMDHDILRHLLVLRMKNSDMILVQLNENFMKAYITENVRFKSFKDEQESITTTCWLPDLNCYVEGSSKGHLKVRDLLNSGECMLELQTNISERI